MEESELAGYIVGAVEKWKSEQYFADSFMERVWEAVKPIATKLSEEKLGGNRYKKTFLSDSGWTSAIPVLRAIPPMPMPTLDFGLN